MGGIPQHETNLKEEESIVTNNFFVGAIQKVIINGAELVLAGPHPSDSEKGATELWENVHQWQGPPCGEDFAACDSEPLRKICRPHGEAYTCSCSTPLMHSVFVQRLTSSLGKVELSIQDQKRISVEAEELACAERALGEVQHDVPEDNTIRSFSQKDSRQLIANEPSAAEGADALKFSTSVNFNGSTILKYSNMLTTRKMDMLTNNMRIFIRTRSENGLLLLIQNSDRHSSHGQEFLVLAVRSGHPEAFLRLHKKDFQYPTDGYQEATVQAKTYVSDGKWHDIQLLRYSGDDSS
ncbi:unnamed protein product [Dibothriocephalus latus]|uniref:Laminin G domain-containing protein n=1 Tax=Dibothriocephalus latus TaxID=60516 RepID=A0A3P7L044_DIBLA|nr:unnamed protein product [Dibothriocephalus latus]